VVGTVVVVGTAAVERVVAVGSTVVVVASVFVAIVAEVDNRSEVVCSWAVVATAAPDIVGMGLVVAASFIPLST
jgi:hypothetical protein